MRRWKRSLLTDGRSSVCGKGAPSGPSSGGSSAPATELAAALAEPAGLTDAGGPGVFNAEGSAELDIEVGVALGGAAARVEGAELGLAGNVAVAVALAVAVGATDDAGSARQ